MPKEQSKFRTKNSVERYNNNCQIKFKITMLKFSLCDYSDAYITVKGTISVAAATVAAANKNYKKEIFKNYAAFPNLINKINIKQGDNAVMMQLCRCII